MKSDRQTVLLRNGPDGGTVADGLRTAFSTSGSQAVDIATAYFNAGGYGLLASELKAFETVRVLLGADPEPPSGRSLNIRSLAPSGEEARVRAALEGQERSLALDRDLLGFSEQQEGLLHSLVNWLRCGRVEVRRFDKRFMHGKAFILPDGESALVAGSSNLTYSGLCRNEELGIGVFDSPPVGEAAQWFDELWEESEVFDLAAVYEARFVEHSPWLIWMKFLWERYGAALLEEAGPSGIHLTLFQRDGVSRALDLLDRQHGVMIADGVGLGKTFIAGAILEEYVSKRRQRALVVAPAALRDGPWKRFLDKHKIFVNCVSFEQLREDPQVTGKPGGTAALESSIDDYSLVIVDEAHNLRNPDTKRAAAMRRLLRGRPRKDLVLMTATPVNNGLDDLYELLSMFIKNDARFAPGIPSMRREFRAAEALDPDDLTPDRLFDIVDATTVRRTRRLVKESYPDDTIEIDGERVPIRFPDPKVIQVDDFTLDDVLPGIFEEVEHALGCGSADEHAPCLHVGALASSPALTLFRYAPSSCRLDKEAEQYEVQLAGLLRSGLLKRFESSVRAFALTCERMAESHDAFLKVMDSGTVLTGRDLKAWIATDNDDLGDWLGRGNAESGTLASEFDVDRLRDAVESDRDILRSLGARAATVEPAEDPKLQNLVEQLADVISGAPKEAKSDEDERNRRKVIIFTYFADTAAWIRDFLEATIAEDERLAPYRGRLTMLSGDDGSKRDVLFGFAPISSEAPPGSDEDRYDLLVTTDVLAEGVNLQQARNIINFDLPWNPMRLVQRHGRIDRIGSRHRTVDIRCFLDRKLDDYLELDERLRRKLAKAARSIGVEGEVLPGSETSDLVFNAVRRDVDDISGLLESGGERGNALSAEEFRQELRRAINDDPALEDKLKTLSWGSGSGFVSDMVAAGQGPVFVFMARIGDRAERLTRVVSMGPDVADDKRIESASLRALSLVRVDRTTARVLDEATHHLAYDAWAKARADISEKWDEQTDPRNRLARIPRALREAADFMQSVGPTFIERERADQIAGALRGVFRDRIVKSVRIIVGSDLSDEDKIHELVGIVEEHALEEDSISEPLPEVDDEDIHLIAWMAIVAANKT